ncbi:unnamed protein product [Closterium sp. Naga37s-1]|nr:unnamed protein product [Closterium sp. Naga37s-1]
MLTTLRLISCPRATRLPGDNGFDPLGLAEDAEALRWYVQAELVHCRWAMLGVAGVLGTDLLTTLGLADLPVWYEAGTAHYDIANAPTLFAVQFILFNFVELKRWADFKAPGSQGQDEAWFLGIQPAFLGTDNGYPGGPLFNPFGLAADAVTGHKAREQELANGEAFWVDYDGKEVAYEKIKPGQTYRQRTFVLHPWAFRECASNEPLVVGKKLVALPEDAEESEMHSQHTRIVDSSASRESHRRWSNVTLDEGWIGAPRCVAASCMHQLQLKSSAGSTSCQLHLLSRPCRAPAMRLLRACRACCAPAAPPSRALPSRLTPRLQQAC